MPWSKSGKHAQLGHPDKVLAINWLVVYNNKAFGMLNGLVIGCCHQPSSEIGILELCAEVIANLQKTIKTNR